MDDLRWRPPSLFWIIFIMCGGLFLYFNIIELQTFPMKFKNIYPTQNPDFIENMHLKGYFIRTPGCSIPEMDPMDASIKKYIFKEKTVVCNNGTPALINSNMTSIFLINSSIPYYNISDAKLLKCCFQEIFRVDPIKGAKDNVIKFNETCHEFKISVKIPYEFIRVNCTYNKTHIYKDFFHFVPLKSINKSKDEAIEDANKLNVLMIGIDALSRLNFYRQMPKTAAYVKKLRAIEMQGYNKVADNTFPNLVPILSGLTEEELTKTCWPTSKDYFDKCPFLWKNYKRAGLTTSFAEDCSWMGLFYYNKRGFLHQPTDYYYNTFDSKTEKEIGNEHRLNAYQCFGARYVHEVLLNYTQRFTLTMHERKQPYFAFFWGTSLSHDYLNKPKLGDDNYVELLTGFNNSGILNNTALIFLSDHGIRWGGIRSTYQGMMEERLPFLFIKLPDWYLDKHNILLDNLKTNTRRLTTPFDLHETLVDLVEPFKLSNEFLLNRYKNDEVRRGYSLFNKIPVTRSCEDAGISAHWCTCQTTKELNTDERIVFEVSNFTIHQHINPLLVGYADCIPLELDEIISARQQMNTNTIMQSYSSQDYTVTFKTLPGGAIFEASVRRYNQSHGEYYFNVTGTVSRINLYGDQSMCVTDFHLKLYCFCKQFL